MYIFQKWGNYDQLSKEPEEIEWSQRRSSGARGDRVEPEEIEWSQRRSSGARGDRVEIEEIEYIVFTLCTTNIFFVLK